MSAWAEGELAALGKEGLRRYLEPLQSPQGPVVRIGTEVLINFASNDYLGLAADPRVVEAACDGLRQYGLGSGASRLMAGDTAAHQALEQALATFCGAEAALVFNSGYAANVGVLSALCGPEDVIFSDELNHASLIDGCRLSRAKTSVYAHGDVAALERLLRQAPGRRRLVCTEAVFSMDGDRAPLCEIVRLCRRYDAALLVDEAHAMGVLGPHGDGLCAELGVGSQADIRMGTLGKAFGAYGAFVAASAPVRDLLLQRARSLVFSTSLPPAVCVAATRAVELVQQDRDLRERLRRNSQRFASGLGVRDDASVPRSAIFPVMMGEPEAALHAAERLRAEGLLVKAVRPPTVPPGTSRLRVTISAAHSEDHIDLAVGALGKVVGARAR